ncbi:hypothetical protein G7078_10055 [Sphingomonas sinipercae]|uniref:Uncharacterized protein n=1 Tax=Sphingomonas sinipercae TaxID=2714944 RepID=A0A6G7ZQA9_9SPHN|nr:hypothetical protein [Sphingomonas sinipercae]QIL03086.1 hypothetical protein G7078_10055 [Sphingomonas sinipercae]
MTRTQLLPLVAAAALAGCNQNGNTIVAGPPEDNLSDLNTANVELPPSIAASKSYRCKDGSVIYIDWLSNGAARVKQDKADAPATELPAGSADIAGDAKAASITYKGQSCKS